MIVQSIRLINAGDYSAEIIDATCANFSAARICQRMSDRDVFVAIIEKQIVGTVSLGAGKLHSLFVSAPLQKRGIGSRLVEHLETHARTKSLSELHLSSSITACAFYERKGYDLVKFEERPDGSTYLMRKALI